MIFRSRGIAASLTVFIVIVSGTMLAFSTSAAHGPPVDNWTVALYIAADNNLEIAWDHYTLRGLLDIPDSDDVNIVAMVDRLSTNGTEFLEFSGDSYEVVATYPEMNTGLGETFSFFLSEVTTMYPSENLCVIAWDHGGSWLGFCSDDSQGGLIGMNDFSYALNDAGVYIDVFALDACIMSTTEVIYEAYTTGLVSYVISSEMYVPFDGFPYDDMFTPLTENPAATPEELCSIMLDGWDAYYHRGRSVNLVVVDVNAFGESLSVFQTWSDALLGGLSAHEFEYLTAVDESLTNDYIATTVDLYDLCEQIIANVEDEVIMEASMAVMSTVDTTVVGLSTSGWAQDMHGLTIWWMSADYVRYLPRYMEEVQFATDSGWGTFLETLYV
ncbi:MAG: hypothetical protein IH630_06390 [Thermoplasmata archaeon]|nr:hypothetical protein [Thermoplasmata archaeon]